MENTNFNNEENNQENEVLNEYTEEQELNPETEEISESEETQKENPEGEEIPEDSANYPKKKKKEKTPARELFEWVQAIVIAVLLAFVIKTFVFGVVRVDGVSMEPTLQTNDRMILWKLGYEPEHGDIIVFSSTATGGRPYIKRVIATEGEHIRIDYYTNSVYVNDVKQDESYINVCTDSDCPYNCNGDSMTPRGDFYDFVVPEGCVFAMGDNRNHSKDCREIGPVSENDIMGKAVLRFWPVKKIKTY